MLMTSVIVIVLKEGKTKLELGDWGSSKRSQNMTNKSILAVAAILALGSLSLATDAFAAHNGGGGHGGGHGGGGGHVAAGRIGGGHGPGAHFMTGHGPGVRVVPGRVPGAGHIAAGHPGRVFVAGGHRRHFWHGRWWYYGVGPCWVWSDVYGEYVWACD
jgi:hypothetical protein